MKHRDTLISTAIDAGSRSALLVGAGAVMLTALIDHVGILSVASNPVTAFHCLYCAAAAASIRVLAFCLPDPDVIGRSCTISSASSAMPGSPSPSTPTSPLVS
jgi:hypothetical protein